MSHVEYMCIICMNQIFEIPYKIFFQVTFKRASAP